MPDGLFRREAIDAQEVSWLGDVRLSSPPAHWLLTSMAGAIAVAALLFLVFGHVARRETVAGELVPAGGLLNVTASAAGIVEKSFVQTGQSVHAGDPLIALSGDVDSPTMGLIDEVTIQSLRGQKSLLNDDLANEDRLAAVQRANLNDKLASLTGELAEINAQIAIQNQQIGTSKAVLDRFLTVGTGGYVSGLQMQQQKGMVFAAQAQLEALARDRDQMRQAIDDTRLQLSQLPMTVAAQRHETQSKLAGIEQSLAKTAADQSLLLRAPADGIVSAIVVKPGQSVPQGAPVVSITPAGSQLIAQLLVPSSAIGFIHPHTALKLRYDAFPYQEFGQADGTVVSISSSALTPAEVASLSAPPTDEPLYMVDVALDRQEMAVYGHAQTLLAGFKLQASLTLDNRRLIDWVFAPIYDAGRGLFGAAKAAP